MFYKKVVAYCKKNNLSVCAFEKLCKIGNGTIGKWEKEKCKPSLQTLEKIAVATETTISEWISEES